MLQTDTNSKIKKRVCPSEDEDDTDDNSDISISDMDNSTFNSGWADAMSKVLRTKSEKFTILKKAKKDSEIVEKAKKDIEIVNEKGELITEISKEKKQDDYSSYQHEKKLLLEQKQKKLLWINMCRTKPDISEKQKERALNRIATRFLKLPKNVEVTQRQVRTVCRMLECFPLEFHKGFLHSTCGVRAGIIIKEDDTLQKQTRPLGLDGSL
ncbi:RRP15-like protein [Centruroides sculpturatus]|uniref:RRP15-like protein n=1 Tax=Centruroides sculpturatus TaxID=218467 RepID=UPI000C6DB715|nr:RRP15-like protein [Centruroides sculpturatus]XP_023226997.1 RRP15-like protein [Centruroides sculpturatus]XP_023226998.1 RRP15-like protein [Centruroides sculpturatus]